MRRKRIFEGVLVNGTEGKKSEKRIYNKSVGLTVHHNGENCYRDQVP